MTVSRRFKKDKLNISDIVGSNPDAYRKQRHYEGREYMEVQDIPGASPQKLKQSKEPNSVDYKLYTKDIQPDKWKSKRIVNPLAPEYNMATKSGRMVRLGRVERSIPRANVSPTTKRLANYVDDIEGTRPKQLTAITAE